MAQPTNAILVPSPLRPNDLEDNYASAFAIDIKGGHHMYALLSERNLIKEGRREWGMLCTVYDDGDNSATYQLVYNYSSTNLMDNNNWVIFTGGKTNETTQVSANTEWISSVFSIVDTPPITNSDGDRYLIATPSFAAFLGQGQKIAQWNGQALSGTGDWVYLTPTEGTTVRVDNIGNVIYRFSGTWSQNGYWKREYLSQIRYIQPTSLDGSTYSFTSSIDSVSLDVYSFSVYYANFSLTNSGTSTLQIDGLGYYPMKKVSSGTLLDLAAQDIVPNVQYHISWNIDNFLVHNIDGGFGNTVSVTIGPAEDGTYEDGLFTDFTQSTPIGTPIDRFNEILLALVPPPAPDLSSWSLGGPQFTSGKLSFDRNTPAGLTPSPIVLIGEDFNPNSPNIYRKGINSYVTQSKTGTTYYADYTGILNSNVGRGPGEPTPAYATYSFGNGITGSIVMKLNGVTISTANLATQTGVIDTTSTNTVSGFTLTAATSSKFPSGFPFEFFWNRTGTYLIKRTDNNLRQGFNYLDMSHILPSKTLILASYSWVADPSTTETTFSSVSINNIIGSAPKYLSGIQFWTQLSLNYGLTIQNQVKNTYVGTNALSSSSVVPVGFNSINNKITETNTPIMGPPSPINITTPTNPNSSQILTWGYSLNTNVRRLNETITFQTQVLRTVQGTDVGGTISQSNFFIDNYPMTSSLLVEEFITEDYRIRNGATKYANVTDTKQSIDNQLDWENTKSLNTESGYTNGLQILNGQLVYPKFNYSTAGGIQTNPNFGLGNVVRYDLCNTTNTGFGTTDVAGTNFRTYTRYFTVDPTSNFAILRFTFNLSDTTFVNSNVNLSDNNCWIEVKLPHDTSKPQPPSGLVGNSVTGWLDMTKPALAGRWNNGDGVYRGSPTPTVIEVDFGQGKSTFFSGGYVLFRITAPSSWSGHINSITLTPLVN